MLITRFISTRPSPGQFTMPSKLGIDISRHVFILLILPLFALAQDIAGWQSLKGFEHFRPLGDKSWTLADGTFTTVRDPRILQDLITKEAYDDFELALEWRLEPGGNSGVKYRIGREGFYLHEQPGYANGRLIDPANLGPTQRGQFFNDALEFQISNLKAPTVRAANLPGEWNTLRLVVNAGRIEHWINEKLVLAAAFTDPAISPRLGPPSPIALQNHADSIAQFRNVKIRRLLPLHQTHLPVQAELGFPSSVAAAPNGEIYLLQRGLIADPIVVINREGKVVRQWGKGLFEIPHSIRLSPDGHVWTVDAASSRILKFTPQGKLLLTINVGEQPKTKSTFNGTADIAFAANGHLFIADGYGNARVLEYSADGLRLNQWGTPGTAPGQFNLPHGLAIDADGIVYVADRENGRIQRFTQTGKFLNEFNGHGKTFALTIADGALWIGSQQLDQPNGTPGWLKKLDRKTGATLGVVDSPGHHSVDVTADGEIFTAVRPDRLLWFKR